MAKANRGWILDRICGELAARLPGRNVVHYGDGTSLPRARAYFFSHFWLYQQAPRSLAGRSIVFFTHPREGLDVGTLAQAAAVVSMSSMHAEPLVAAGARVHVAIPGSDPDRFDAHERGDGVVGFCSAYYERKAPGVVLGLPLVMPHRRFLLLGRGWEVAPGFASAVSLGNFEYVESAYEDYPRHYGRMDVFVSPSEVEGGPIPLLEAMLSNAVPVATRTGFAPDVVDDGRNGVLLDVGAPVEAFAAAVERAAAMPGDIRSTVAHITWERFAAQVAAVVGGVA